MQSQSHQIDLTATGPTLAEQGEAFRQPFSLTTEQFLGLRQLSPAQRDMMLGIYAHRHEWEQQRRVYHCGGPGLMPAWVESRLAKEWPSIRDAKLDEARQAFAYMARGEAA